MPITVSLRNGDPGWGRGAVFDRGDPIETDFAVSAGEYRLVSELPACSVVVALAPNAETDVVMHIMDAGACVFERRRCPPARSVARAVRERRPP